MQHLKPTPIRKEKYADAAFPPGARIEVLKREHYCVVEGYSIMGEAPKSFIRVYGYKKDGPQRKINRNSWTLFLAKTGHKWYPIESITEHLIARIGVVLGLNMAESRLAIAGGQIKFLSKYFLKPEKGQELVHGMDILATHLGDRTFVEEIAVKKRERDFFTLEDTVAAIEQVFPYERTAILEAFFLMLCFDTWVGVQDRHFQNWGVVRDIYEKKRPYFSPIYDSARGLFWNHTEKKIADWVKAKQAEQQIESQIKNSMPQLTLTNKPKVNHFELAEALLSDRFLPFKSIARKIFTDESLERVQVMVRKEFGQMFSQSRVDLICKCLEIRHQKFSELLF
ncbi:MAG: HipA domain-containing protein [Saprospiraceae bacterium]